jgi:hypothetical protein
MTSKGLESAFSERAWFYLRTFVVCKWQVQKADRLSCSRENHDILTFATALCYLRRSRLKRLDSGLRACF